MRLFITRKAEQDLLGIMHFTLLEFGAAQVQKYSSLMDEGFKLILKSPSLGHKRRDLPGHMLVFPVGQHLIIYTIEAKQGIVILRVLHSRMDFSDRI